MKTIVCIIFFAILLFLILKMIFDIKEIRRENKLLEQIEKESKILEMKIKRQEEIVKATIESQKKCWIKLNRNKKMITNT